MLFESVVEAFPKVTQPLEGCVLWPYLDVFGYATVGYGCLCDSESAFMAVGWNSNPPKAQVLASRRTLKAQKKALHFNQYRNATYLRLTQAEADELMIARAREFAAYMQSRHFPEWSDWPADAQLAWMLIAWACGPGSPAIFTTAAAASKRRDWATFARFAKIKVGTKGQADYNPGIVPRNAQIALCAANALAIDSPDGYATPALYWPGTVKDKLAPAVAHASAELLAFNVAECGLTGSCHLPEAA